MTGTMLNTQSDQPVHKEAQRLRWFLDSFQRQLEITSKETGNNFDVALPKLTETFAIWLKSFEDQKPSHPDEKPAYVGFASGLMLKALVTTNPVQMISIPESADTSNPAYFWPEGYLYVAYCLNVRGLVIESDYDGEQLLSDTLNETRTWWSFKENVQEDASLAIAFLDMFAGEQPDWDMPQLFKSGQVKEVAIKFYSQFPDSDSEN